MPALKTDADVPGNEVLHAFADFRTVPRAQAQALTDFGGTHRIGGIGKPKPGPAAEPHVAAAAAHPCAHGFPPFFTQCGRLGAGPFRRVQEGETSCQKARPELSLSL